MRNYTPFLSLRYLWFHKASTGLGVLGVSLGVGLVIVVVAVMDGFQARLKEALLGSAAPLMVDVDYDVDADRLADEIKSRVPGVREASPVLQTFSLISFEGIDRSRRRRQFPCRILAIDADREARVNDLRKYLKFSRASWGSKDEELRGIYPADPDDPFLVGKARKAMDRMIRPEKRGVILGIKLAVDMKAYTGGDVRLWTVKEAPKGDAGNGGPGGNVPLESELFMVTGLYDSQNTEVDGLLVLMDRRDAHSFFRANFPYEADQVRLRLDDPERAEEVKRAINGTGKDHPGIAADLVAASRRGPRTGSTPLVAKTWKDDHRRLLAAVENERGLLVVITSFTFLVVAFLIASTQSMLVVEKTREIGVLRSLGGSVAGTAGIFLGNGFFIGTFGAAAGAALGIAVTGNILEIAGFIQGVTGRELFPEDIYNFREIPIEVRAGVVGTIVGVAVAFAVAGSLLPALRAATLRPVESLHHE